MKNFIPVAAPALIGNEKDYVLDCINSSWISSNGKYIDLFERGFANYLGIKHAISCCNGTAALHIALLAMGVGPGDEVIVPTLTYVATANAVTYCGATPIFVDIERETWNLSPDLLEELITDRTKGIIAVHLYGHPVDMDRIIDIANQHKLFIIEDAAEAHGAEYRGRKVGTLGDISTFSFYGNKIISTGEGGMICTNNDQVALLARQLKGQGQDAQKRFWFPIVGFNYRMTNIEAAIGLAQLERIEWHINRRRELANWYRKRLLDNTFVSFSPEMPWAKSSYWLSSVLLNLGIDRDKVSLEMLEHGVETRPFFYPMHALPIYQGQKQSFPVSDEIAKRGINLPSSALLTEEQVSHIVEVLLRSIDNCRRNDCTDG